MPMRAATVVASLAGLVLSFIACFILLVIAPLKRTEEWRVAASVEAGVGPSTTPSVLLAGRRLAERTHLIGMIHRLVAEQTL